jgi:hypothetical protein
MLPHLHLAAVAVVLSISWATAAAADQRRPIALPGCPDKCGNISIPYPFGTKAGCYFDETFSITCNLSTTPPATLDDLLTLRGIGFYYGDQANPTGVRTNRSWWTVDLVDIDVTRGEARVSMPASSDCSLNESYHELNLNHIRVIKSPPCLAAPQRFRHGWLFACSPRRPGRLSRDFGNFAKEPSICWKSRIGPLRPDRTQNTFVYFAFEPLD